MMREDEVTILIFWFSKPIKCHGYIHSDFATITIEFDRFILGQFQETCFSHPFLSYYFIIYLFIRRYFICNDFLSNRYIFEQIKIFDSCSPILYFYVSMWRNVCTNFNPLILRIWNHCIKSVTNSLSNCSNWILV